MTDSGMSQEEQSKIVDRFQRLREEQAEIVSEISRIEEERREFQRVLEQVKGLEPERKCHQLVSDTLVEMKVENIVPNLESHVSSLEKLRETLNEKLVGKGKELNTHKEKYNIRFLTERETMALRQSQLQQMQKPAA